MNILPIPFPVSLTTGFQVSNLHIFFHSSLDVHNPPTCLSHCLNVLSLCFLRSVCHASNISKIFAASDFNYSDGDSDSLSKIKITTLESAGVLEYSSNGSSWADVTLNQEITASDIGNNRLRFTPAANSESNVTFGFKVHDGTDYSSSAYTMTVSVNAAPNVTDATVGSTVSADGTSSGDVHDGVADSDDADSVLVVTGVASGNESSNNSIVTNNTGVGSAVSGTYGTLNIAANGTYTYTASSTNNIAYDATATDIFTFTTRDDETASGSFAYDVGSITFTVASSISLTDDTDSVNEDATITKTGSQDDVLNDDAADTNGLVVTHIKKDGGSNSTVASSSTYTSNGTSVTGTYGTLVIGADGSYTYTADQSAADDLDLNDEVTDVFVYTADGATANLTITVTGINDVPEAADKTVTTNEDTAYVFSASDFGYTDADDDDALVSVKITGLEDAGALQYNNGSAWVDVTLNQVITATDIAANKLRFNPAANENGSSYTSFDFTVNDGDADSASANTITVNVTAVNDAPVADDETNSVNEDATLTVTDGSSDVLHGDTDVDSGDTLTVTTYSHTSATNQSGGSASSANGNSGTAGTNAVVGYYGTLTLAADGTYTYAADQSAADDLDASDTATDVFTYTLSDGTATDTATITITVTGINDAPVAVNDTDAVNEDATVTRTSGDNLLMADDSDADDDDSFTVTQIAVTGASNSSVASSSSYNSNFTSITGTYGTLKVGADGTYTYVADQSASDDLDASDTATDSFTYTVSDGTATDTATLIFTVTGINDAPVAVNDTDALNEDATVTRSSGSSLLMADDSDADDDDAFTVTQIAVTGGSNSSVAGSSTYNNNFTSVTGTYGTLKIGANGTYTYVADQSASDDLDASDTATDSFTYTVSDGNATDTATLIFTVTGVNDVPTASNNTVSTEEDTPYVFSTSDFGYTDADDDDALVSVKITTLEDAGALQYYNGSNWVDVTLNQVITATDISNSYLRLNPTADENGSPYTTIGFSVNDGDADSASSYTMTINVTAINDNPVADNETNTATEGTTTTVTDGTSDILYGDTDTEGDTLEISGIRTGTESGSGTFGAIATPLTGTYGSLTINSDGTYSYTPNDVLGSGETGIDYFTYTVSDGNGGTDTGQLTITVTGANDAPVGVNDSNTIDIAATSTLTVTNDSEKDVLTNDTDPDSNDTSIVTEIRTGSTEGSGTAGTLGEALIGTYGSLIMNSNGSYTYIVNEGLKDTLDPGEIVYEYFNYTVRDGSGVTDTSSIVLKLQNGGGVVKEIREKKAERIIINQARMEARVQVENTFTELNQSTEFDLNNFEFEQTARKTDYSQGLKLVDLVAETDSLQISEGELSNLKVKDKQEGLKLKFGVMNEADNEIVKFDGKMSDGSALPEWIKINPKTGQTTTNIPEGVDKVEIMIIATDKNNETREIAVEIDPEKIKQDRKIIKQAKRTNSSITVNEDGTVNIVKQNEDGLVERSFNKTLNFNNPADINEIIETFKPETIFQLKPLNIGNDLIIDLPNELKGNFNNTKLVLKDGTEVPDWLEYDPVTGQIIAENPPEDVSQLELKLIIEQDGKIIVKDLEVDLQEQNVSQNFDGGENNRFVTLSDQLDKEFNDWEDYGNDLINRL